MCSRAIHLSALRVFGILQRTERRHRCIKQGQLLFFPSLLRLVLISLGFIIRVYIIFVLVLDTLLWSRHYCFVGKIPFAGFPGKLLCCSSCIGILQHPEILRLNMSDNLTHPSLLEFKLLKNLLRTIAFFSSFAPFDLISLGFIIQVYIVLVLVVLDGLF